MGGIFTSHFEYVHGGALEDLLASTSRVDYATSTSRVDYATLRSVLWNGQDDAGFWQAAAVAARWRYRAIVEGPKGARELCFEIEFPDGSFLARPALASMHVGSARCERAGMSRICTSEIELSVGPDARSEARRCRSTSAHEPTATLSEPRAARPTAHGAKSYDLTPAAASHVRQALLDLREHLCTWGRVARALGSAEATLNHMVGGSRPSGERKPTPDIAFRISRLLGISVGDVLSGRLPDLSLGHPNLDLSEAEAQYVRAALRVLRGHHGVKKLRQMLALSSSSLDHLISGHHRKITPTLAYRVALLGGVGMDDLLAGRFPELQQRLPRARREDE